MADHTGIEWAEATWNPVVGCSLHSPGCTHCYAMKMAARIERIGGKAGGKYRGLTQPSKAGPVWTGRVAVDVAALDQPLRWRRPRRIFVNSMSDLFHEDLPDSAIDQVFAVMALAPQHTFIVLTKRAARMRDYAMAEDRYECIYHEIFAGRLAEFKWPNPDVDASGKALDCLLKHRFLPNVILGVSIEDQERADERVPLLLDTSAALRIVSAEPLLGPLDLRAIDIDGWSQVTPLRAWTAEELTEEWGEPRSKGQPRLDGVIVGGESGPGARPMHPDWARDLRDQCTAAAVPFFFKQWGEWAPGECAPGPQTRTEDTASWFDGRWDFDRQTPAQGAEGHADDEPDVYRFGKRRAGRLLDGRTWDEMPEVRPHPQPEIVP